MIKKSTRYSIYKHAILLLAVFLSAAMQNAAGAMLSTANIGLFLLIPLCVSIAMFEKEFAGMFYGLLIGAMWDITSPLTDGVWALFFAATASVCGLLSHYVMRNSHKSAFLLCACVITLFCTISVVLNCIARDNSELIHIIKYFYIPSGIASLLILPLSYNIVRLAEMRFRIKSEV